MGNIEPNPAVTVIVVTHNSAESVLPSLEAWDREIREVGGDIIVFDNNSTDSTVSSIRTQFPHIDITTSRQNRGFGAANNSAAHSAKGKYLLFSNPDVIPDMGMLKIMINEFQKAASCGALCARLRNPDGTFQPTCRNLPTRRNIFFSRGSLLRRFAESNGFDHVYTLGDFSELTAVPASSATCLLMERDYFISLGGFDERFFLFMEDTDLSVRIGQAGGKIYFVPSAGAVHNWGKGAAISTLRRQWHHHVAVWKYFLKYYPNGFTLFILPLALCVNFLLTAMMGRRSASGMRKE